MSAKPGSDEISKAALRATLLATLALFLLILTSCGTPVPTTMMTGEPPSRVVTVEVPVTVEVTREILRETASLATPRPPAPCAPTRLSDATEIVVAVLAPTSLPNSLPTVLATHSGLVLAIEELMARTAPDRPNVQLWWADSANDPEIAAQRAEEAILQQCAVSLISASNSETSAAIDQVARRWSIPLLLIDGLSDALTETQSPTLFRLTPTNSMIADACAQWMAAVGDYNQDGVSHAVLIIENNEWAQLQARLIVERMQSARVAVEVYPVDLPAADFSSLIARLVVKEALPDAIFVRLGGDAGLKLHKQLLDNGVGPTGKSLIVISRSGAELPAFWSALGANATWTVVMRAGAWHGTVNGASHSFVNEYARLFGRWPELTAFAAHDALLLILDAIERAGSLRGNALIEALEESDILLAGGHYNFDADTARNSDNGRPSWAWRQWLGQPILFLQLGAPFQSLDDAAVIWPPEYAVTELAFLRPDQ